MYKHNDLQGKRFGRLSVLQESGRAKDRHILWKGLCDCGNETTVAEGFAEAIRIAKYIAPTVDAVPVVALVELRDHLYDNDQITMGGLAKMNRLIAEHEGGAENG